MQMWYLQRMLISWLSACNLHKPKPLFGFLLARKLMAAYNASTKMITQSCWMNELEIFWMRDFAKEYYRHPPLHRDARSPSLYMCVIPIFPTFIRFRGDRRFPQGYVLLHCCCMLLLHALHTCIWLYVLIGGKVFYKQSLCIHTWLLYTSITY